jgi:hypothetical protein
VSFIKTTTSNNVTLGSLTTHHNFETISIVDGTLSVYHAVDLSSVSTEELTAELLSRTGLGKELE